MKAFLLALAAAAILAGLVTVVSLDTAAKPAVSSAADTGDNRLLKIGDTEVYYLHDTGRAVGCWAWAGATSCLQDSAYLGKANPDLSGYHHEQLPGVDVWYLHDDLRHVSCWTWGDSYRTLSCLADADLQPSASAQKGTHVEIAGTGVWYIHDDARNVTCWTGVSSHTQGISCLPD